MPLPILDRTRSKQTFRQTATARSIRVNKQMKHCTQIIRPTNPNEPQAPFFVHKHLACLRRQGLKRYLSTTAIGNYLGNWESTVKCEDPVYATQQLEHVDTVPIHPHNEIKQDTEETKRLKHRPSPSQAQAGLGHIDNGTSQRRPQRPRRETKRHKRGAHGNEPNHTSQLLTPTNDQLVLELASNMQQHEKLKKQMEPFQQRVSDAEEQLVKQQEQLRSTEQ